MNQELYQKYVEILKSELVPALGCTEPIALAYAAAVARKELGQFPKKTGKRHGSFLKRDTVSVN